MKRFSKDNSGATIKNDLMIRFCFTSVHVLHGAYCIGSGENTVYIQCKCMTECVRERVRSLVLNGEQSQL